MKFKCLKFTVLFAVFSMTAFGCGKSTADAKQPESGENMIRFSDTYEKHGDGTVVFEAEVIAPEEITAEVDTDIVVSYIRVDFEKLLQEFLPEGTDMDALVRKKYLEDENNEDSLYENAYNDEVEIGDGYYDCYVQMTDWKSLRYAFNTSESLQSYNMDLYETEQTFSFGSAEEVYADLKERLRGVGMKLDLQCETFYADYQTLQEQFVPVNGEDAIFDETDSGYYFSATQLVEGLPVYACWYFGSGIEGGIDEANVRAYIDSRGIEMVRIERVIDEITYGEKMEPLLTLEEIAEAVEKRFAMVMTDNKIVVTELKLCYMTDPINDYQLRLIPVWMCNYEVTDQSGYTSVQQILINAVTAEEVIYAL